LAILKKKILRIPLVALCLLGPFVAWLGFGRHGFIHLYRVEDERQAYIERINKLTEENQALFEEIRRMRTDPKHVEMVARRELGLIRKNEVIYRFKDGNSPEKPINVEVSGEKKPDELNGFPKGKVKENGTIK
jgi:cell division protein FtsB